MTYWVLINEDTGRYLNSPHVGIRLFYSEDDAISYGKDLIGYKAIEVKLVKTNKEKCLMRKGRIKPKRSI